MAIDEAAVRQLDEEEQRQLMRLLARLESERLPPADRRSRRGEIALVVIVACCILLAAWTGWLAATLPGSYRTGSWRGAWVGFDIALLAVFAATGWAAWRRRQMVITSLIVLATLLVCDAWFDVILDVETSQRWFSLGSALLVELPLAALAALTARRLLRLSFGRIMRYEGATGPVPPLWKVPLFGPAPAPLRQLVAEQLAHFRESRASPATAGQPDQAGTPPGASPLPQDGRQRRGDVGVAEHEPGAE